jgi:tetratricopeptide (TPR) repeat protein
MNVDRYLSILSSELDRGKSYADLEMSFQNIAKIFPNSLVAHYYLSLIYIEQFSWQKAISELSQTLQILLNKNIKEDLLAEICRIRLLRAKIYLNLFQYSLAYEDINWILARQNSLPDSELLLEALNTQQLGHWEQT